MNKLTDEDVADLYDTAYEDGFRMSTFASTVRVLARDVATKDLSQWFDLLRVELDNIQSSIGKQRERN